MSQKNPAPSKCNSQVCLRPTGVAGQQHLLFPYWRGSALGKAEGFRASEEWQGRAFSLKFATLTGVSAPADRNQPRP